MSCQDITVCPASHKLRSITVFIAIPSRLVQGGNYYLSTASTEGATRDLPNLIRCFLTEAIEGPYDVSHVRRTNESTRAAALIELDGCLVQMAVLLRGQTRISASKTTRVENPAGGQNINVPMTQIWINASAPANVIVNTESLRQLHALSPSLTMDWYEELEELEIEDYVEQ